MKKIPLYDLEGAGPHLYMEMTKRNITTGRALAILRDFFGDRDQEFGVAGRKDKRAVTTQRINLEHLEPEDVEDFHHDKISLTVLNYHRNKLQPGHLEGNRFTIKITLPEPPCLQNKISDIPPICEKNNRSFFTTLKKEIIIDIHLQIFYYFAIFK